MNLQFGRFLQSFGKEVSRYGRHLGSDGELPVDHFFPIDNKCHKVTSSGIPVSGPHPPQVKESPIFGHYPLICTPHSQQRTLMSGLCFHIVGRDIVNSLACGSAQITEGMHVQIKESR